MKRRVPTLSIKTICLIFLFGCPFVMYYLLIIGKNKFPGTYISRTEPRGPTILLWTTLFGSKDFFFGLGRQGFVNHKCPIYNCTITDNRSLFSESDAVVFHVRDFKDSDVPDPRFRLRNQYWIFLSHESPMNSFLDLRPLNGFFNWTMTYRLDSDVRLTFGETLPIEQVAVTSPTDVIKERKLVGWMVGHCDTDSHRERYVEQLRKYLQVDQFGLCNQRPCVGKCEDWFYGEYKFYLSLENSLCKDYVTEKFYKVLRHEMVPVVYGLGNYSDMAPPHSYIDVRDFESPEKLARYLLALDANQTAYNEYFKWKTHYKVRLYSHPNFCDLCRRLHQHNPPKVYKNIYNWWHNGAEESNTSVCVSSLPIM